MRPLCTALLIPSLTRITDLRCSSTGKSFRSGLLLAIAILLSCWLLFQSFCLLFILCTHCLAAAAAVVISSRGFLCLLCKRKFIPLAVMDAQFIVNRALCCMFLQLGVRKRYQPTAPDHFIHTCRHFLFYYVIAVAVAVHLFLTNV